ncbi:MAG: rod shape-determining protein MreC [Pseudomonadota bacterium]
MVVDSMRRWWARYGLALVLSTLVLGGAFGLQQTRGAGLVELYRMLTLPFQPEIDVDRVLRQTGTEQMRTQLRELQHQNQQLRGLLSLQKTLGNTGIVAPTIARSADHWWQQLTLGRGQFDGVRVGDAAIAPGGLVGRVEAVTPHTSRVLLISSPTSRVGVSLSRTRAMGVLRGTGSHMAVMQFFDKEPQAQVGDTVVTSGISSLYPSGLALGTIRSVDLQASPSPEAAVELAVPLNILEWVSIHHHDTTLFREAASEDLANENLSIAAP